MNIIEICIMKSSSMESSSYRVVSIQSTYDLSRYGVRLSTQG